MERYTTPSFLKKEDDTLAARRDIQCYFSFDFSVTVSVKSYAYLDISDTVKVSVNGNNHIFQYKLQL